jgi:hypothetical protein
MTSLMVLRQPLTQARLAGRGTLRSQQISHQALVLFPGQDNIPYEPTVRSVERYAKGVGE